MDFRLDCRLSICHLHPGRRRLIQVSRFVQVEVADQVQLVRQN